MRKGCVSWFFSVLNEKAWEKSSHVYEYLKEGNTEDEARLFLAVSSGRIGVNEHKIKHKRFPLNIRTLSE